MEQELGQNTNPYKVSLRRLKLLQPEIFLMEMPLMENMKKCQDDPGDIDDLNDVNMIVIVINKL